MTIKPLVFVAARWSKILAWKGVSGLAGLDERGQNFQARRVAGVVLGGGGGWGWGEGLNFPEFLNRCLRYISENS